MPTIFSHSIAALAIANIKKVSQNKFKFYLIIIFLASVPDADVISFKFGIPYSNMFGHRGITHSIFFSIILGFITSKLFYKFKFFSFENLFLSILFSIIVLSHAILDAFTNGGLGVCLYCPLNQDRIFFSIRPILVSPIGKNFFSSKGIEVLKSEFIWIWIPSILLFLYTSLIKKIRIK